MPDHENLVFEQVTDQVQPSAVEVYVEESVTDEKPDHYAEPETSEDSAIVDDEQKNCSSSRGAT